MQITAENSDKTEMSENEITSQTLSFYKLLSEADQLDWILMSLGTLGSIVHGLAQPIGFLLLGKALDAFGNHINDTDEMVTALKKVRILHDKLLRQFAYSSTCLLILLLIE